MTKQTKPFVMEDDFAFADELLNDIEDYNIDYISSHDYESFAVVMVDSDNNTEILEDVVYWFYKELEDAYVFIDNFNNTFVRYKHNLKKIDIIADTVPSGSSWYFEDDSPVMDAYSDDFDESRDM